MGRAAKLVLDAGPLINLTREQIVQSGDQLYATPAVIREVRDEDARRRLELLKNDITVLQPGPASIKFAADFAKLTGDGLVLSAQDIEVIALAYELVADKSRLRTRPVVAGTAGAGAVVVDNENGAPAAAADAAAAAAAAQEDTDTPDVDDDGFTIVKPKASKPPKKTARKPSAAPPSLEKLNLEERPTHTDSSKDGPSEAASEVASEAASCESAARAGARDGAKAADHGSRSNDKEEEEDDDSDWSDDGWIGPANVQDKMQGEAARAGQLDEDVEVAVASRDYAVQNTALQIGLCAVNERGLRIKQLKSYMQRCYACFHLIPLGAQPRQFCPRCGGHTLTRVSTSLDRHGVLHVHLKAQMQWITRGDRYNVPNPQSRRARRQQHDTKREFYAEDQPEYVKALKKQQWQQRRNERLAAEYIGPSTVDSAMSPFAPLRQHAPRVQIGRGRNANETGKKTEYSLR